MPRSSFISRTSHPQVRRLRVLPSCAGFIVELTGPDPHLRAAADNLQVRRRPRRAQSWLVFRSTLTSWLATCNFTAPHHRVRGVSHQGRRARAGAATKGLCKHPSVCSRWPWTSSISCSLSLRSCVSPSRRLVLLCGLARFDFSKTRLTLELTSCLPWCHAAKINFTRYPIHEGMFRGTILTAHASPRASSKHG